MKNLHIKLLFAFCLFTSALQGQWQQLPNLPVSGTVYDMWFVNANTGLITVLSPYNLIKTSNGGVSWFVIPTDSFTRPAKMQFFNDTLGIGMGQDPSFISYITKTTNCGLNWTRINSSGSVYQDMYFVNKDTGWVCGYDGNNDRVWRTTDGGVSFQSQFSNPGFGADKLFFLKQKINNEYWGWVLAGHLYRTTNSGASWNMIFGSFSAVCSSLEDMFFKDTLNGIITRNLSCFSLTTNGGYNWVDVSEWYSADSHIGMGNDTIGWLTLATDSVLKTNNFFLNYGKQPIPITSSTEIFALDTFNVYAGRNQSNMMKTTNGGGPLVGIEQISSNVPAGFSLSQNYPNPFNPQTTVEFSLSKDAYVTLTIYDILGKEVSAALNNEYITAGTYKAVLDFGKINVTSGVYFYKVSVSDGSAKIFFTESKKLVYIK